MELESSLGIETSLAQIDVRILKGARVFITRAPFRYNKVAWHPSISLLK